MNLTSESNVEVDAISISTKTGEKYARRFTLTGVKHSNRNTQQEKKNGVLWVE